MANLPAADLGIMSEHLTAHKGVIPKLDLYQDKVTNNKLREIIRLQANTMRVHIDVMLALINPHHHGYVELPSLNTIHSESTRLPSHTEYQDDSDNQWITLEAHTTAKSMSNDNYFSALMMKDKNVKRVHAEMALQQLHIMDMYTAFMKRIGWEFTPYASTQEQIKTYQHFLHMFAHPDFDDM